MSDVDLLTKLSEDLQQFNKALDADHARLDEAVFKRDFLPLLLSGEEVDLRPWVAIAGHPGRSVDIVSGKGDKTKILYTVPPLINMAGFTRNDDYSPQDSGYERIMQAHREASSAGPARAKAIYDKHLSSIALNPKTIPAEHIEQWNVVLRANGMKPFIKGGAAVTRTEKADDIEGYEDL